MSNESTTNNNNVIVVNEIHIDNKTDIENNNNEFILEEHEKVDFEFYKECFNLTEDAAKLLIKHQRFYDTRLKIHEFWTNLKVLESIALLGTYFKLILYHTIKNIVHENMIDMLDVCFILDYKGHRRDIIITMILQLVLLCAIYFQFLYNAQHQSKFNVERQWTILTSNFSFLRRCYGNAFSNVVYIIFCTNNK